MNIFQKPISCSLSPNAEIDDVLLALRQLLSPQTWQDSKPLEKLNTWFSHAYPGFTGCAFNSGRGALSCLLQSFGIGEGDDVIVQAFTCVAVPGAVLATGARPVYADIDATLNIDPLSLKSRISKRTKAIVVQHTFGVPAEMHTIVAIAKKHKVLLFEDCAHSLGAKLDGKAVGSFGDGAFFSFGRDKVVSSVFGGYAIVADKHKQSIQKLQEIQESLPAPDEKWITRQLLHPVIFALALPLYKAGVGKVIIALAKFFKFLSPVIYDGEKRGEKVSQFPKQYSAPLARLAIHQLHKLEKFTKNRHQNCNLYSALLPKHIKHQEIRGDVSGLRYTIFVDNSEKILQNAKKQGIVLGNWYRHLIDPSDVRLSDIGYMSGSCPHAELLAKKVINLPTRITPEQVAKVASFFV